MRSENGGCDGEDFIQHECRGDCWRKSIPNEFDGHLSGHLFYCIRARRRGDADEDGGGIIPPFYLIKKQPSDTSSGGCFFVLLSCQKPASQKVIFGMA